MIEGWVLWLFVVGIAIGVVATWLVLGRLPRGEADVDVEERRSEAAWISTVIERHGGVAPRLLVEEVLSLHQLYLDRARPAVASRPGDPTAMPADPYAATNPGAGAPPGARG